MHLLLIGLSHRVAEVELREKAALDRGQVTSVLDQLQARSEVSGALALATCGRTEVYVTGPHLSGLEAAVRAALRGIHPDGYPQYAGSLYMHADQAAAQHLFRVASGLDSLLVGESEILGQVRSALRAAREGDLLDPLLGGTADRAVAAARRARREMDRGRRPPSVGVAAGSFLRSSGVPWGRGQAVLVGSGELAEQVAPVLASRVARLMVVSRTAARAAGLAARHGAVARPFKELGGLVASSELVVYATTSTEPLLGPADLVQRPPESPLMILDLAVPRNVDPAVGRLAGITLVGVDELSRRAIAGREAETGRAAGSAEEVLQAELGSWSEWFAIGPVSPTLAEIGRYADGIRRAELERALRGLELDPRVQRRLETLSRSLVAKLLIHPISYLRAHPDDRQAVELLERIFSRPPDSRWS